MLALSDESSKTVEPFLNERNVPYPNAAGSSSGSQYKIRGYPSAFLIDHEGVILWEGHPMDETWLEMVPNALSLANAASGRWEPGERDEAVKRAAELARKGDMKGAWKESTRLLDKYADDVNKLDSVKIFRDDFLMEAEAQIELANGYAEKGCYYVAMNMYESAEEAFEDTPLGPGITQKLKEWEDNKELKPLIDLDKKRQKYLVLKNEKDRKKAISKLRDLRKKAKDTPLYEVFTADIKRMSAR